MRDDHVFTTAWLDAFYSTSNELVTVIDVDATVRWVSPSLSLVLDAAPNELVGRSALEMVHADDVERLAENLIRRFDIDGDDLGAQCRLVATNGAEVPTFITARAIELEHGPGLVVRMTEDDPSSRITNDLRSRLVVDEVIREARSRLRRSEPDDRWTEVVPHLIDQSARLVGGDRAVFVLRDPHHPTGQRRIDWAVDGKPFADPSIEELQFADRAFETIWVDATHPPTSLIQSYMEPRGFAGILITPIGDPTNHRGALGVASVRSGIQWTTNDLHLLQSIADVIDDAATLSEWQDRYELAVNHAPLGVTLLRFGEQGQVLDVNDRHGEITGLPADMVIGAPVEAIDPWIVDGQDWREVLAETGTAEFEVAFPEHRAQQRTLRCHVAGKVVDGELRLGVVHTEDVSERLQLAERLAFAASHDALTGIPNRGSLINLLHETLARSPELTVMFIDLDDFKDVNDAHGHAAGDRILTAVADRLRTLVRDTDVVGRVGGDEFVIVSTAITDALSAASVADRMLHAVSQPIDLETTSVAQTISIGVASAESGLTAEELLARADFAMYEAKQAGRNRYAIYDDHTRQRVEERRQLIADMRAALGTGQFEVWLQPEVRLRDRRLVGFEALARWRHPQRGLVSAADFIAAAEATDLMMPLGAELFGTACEAMAKIRPLVGRDLHLRVNLSRRQLLSDSIVDLVAEGLETSQLDPSSLCCEITETALIDDPDGVVDRLERLRATGVQLAIDDFGTGYSSLTHLHQFPVSVLKIDQSFVRGLGVDRDATMIIRSVLGLASSLDLSVVAEGVETDEQRRLLLELGCDSAQGYYFGRPMPPLDIPAHVEASTVIRH